MVSYFALVMILLGIGFVGSALYAATHPEGGYFATPNACGCLLALACLIGLVVVGAFKLGTLFGV